MRMSAPTPPPAEIQDRIYYEFTVRIEGVIRDTDQGALDETEALAMMLHGVIMRAAPDRWSSVNMGPVPASREVKVDA